MFSCLDSISTQRANNMLFLASFVAGTLKLHLQMQLKIENINQTKLFFFRVAAQQQGIGWIFPLSLERRAVGAEVSLWQDLLYQPAQFTAAIEPHIITSSSSSSQQAPCVAPARTTNPKVVTTLIAIKLFQTYQRVWLHLPTATSFE